MKMNKLIRLIVLAFALSMPISIWGQCASIYQKGETYMKSIIRKSKCSRVSK